MNQNIQTTFWWVAICLGLGTLLIRLSFIHVLDKVRIPERAQAMLAYIPAAVLPALVFPAIFSHADGGPHPERIIAAAVAAAIAWRFRNMLLTLGAGMATLWLCQWLAL